MTRLLNTPQDNSALERLASEVPGWLAHNFPNATQEQQLLGMGEELGELADETLLFEEYFPKCRSTETVDDQNYIEQRIEKIIDGCCDLIVFASSYFGQRGWSIAEGVSLPLECSEGVDVLDARGVDLATARSEPSRIVPILTREFGMAYRHHLKANQDIREGDGALVQAPLCNLVRLTCSFLMIFGSNPNDAIKETWDHVSGRDWQAYPRTGRPETEAIATEAGRALGLESDVWGGDLEHEAPEDDDE